MIYFCALHTGISRDLDIPDYIQQACVWAETFILIPSPQKRLIRVKLNLGRYPSVHEGYPLEIPSQSDVGTLTYSHLSPYY